MCDSAGSPVGLAGALAQLEQALDHLNATDATALPACQQAEALRALGRAEAKHAAARARMLGAFATQRGFEDDGHGTARTWLKWQTRVTASAAAGAVASARRLAAHPAIGLALAAGELSPSWARHLCEWTDRLPEAQRCDADEILAGAARGGADLAGLAGLAREMYERCCWDGSIQPPEDGFEDRWFRLGITFRGAGRAEGDLTPGCAAALAAVLDALGKKAGPEDTRTGAQRRHDALEEACRRLIRAGMIPARAGQPTQVQVHMTLGQLRGLPGASGIEDAWAAARASQFGWVTGPEGEAALCDATVVPVVTGHVDWAALDHLTETFLLTHEITHRTSSPPAQPAQPVHHAAPGASEPDTDAVDTGPRAGPEGTGLGAGRRAGHRGGPGEPGCALVRESRVMVREGRAMVRESGPVTGAAPDSGHLRRRASSPWYPGSGGGAGAAGEGVASGCGCGRDGGLGGGPLSRASRGRLRRALLGLAADALSGPDGLAARLRAALDGRPLTSVSLPLDIGAATETIPAHLRRAVTIRHAYCAFPGCGQPAAVCDIHHIIPRSRGGPTSLPNLVPLCGFHHLTAIHRWGWMLALHPDGTTTATSPDRTRTLHSHGPPSHGPPGHDPPRQAA